MANVSSINPESLRISSKCSSKILPKAKSATDGSSKSATLPPSALTAAISSMNHEFIFSRWSARIPEDGIHVLLFHNRMSDQRELDWGQVNCSPSQGCRYAAAPLLSCS